MSQMVLYEVRGRRGAVGYVGVDDEGRLSVMPEDDYYGGEVSAADAQRIREALEAAEHEQLGQERTALDEREWDAMRRVVGALRSLDDKDARERVLAASCVLLGIVPSRPRVENGP